MTDKELVAILRIGESPSLRIAADRIEALEENRDRLREAGEKLLHALAMSGTGKMTKLPAAIELEAALAASREEGK